MKKEFLKTVLLATIITIGIAVNNIIIDGDTSRTLLGWAFLWITTFTVGLVVYIIAEVIFKCIFKNHKK